MSLRLMSKEELVWTSFAGKNYRRFVLMRDLIITAAVSVITNQGITAMIPSIPGNYVTIFTWVIAVLGVVFSLFNQINFYLVRYHLTTERAVIQYGILSRRITSINLENIQDTKVFQSFFDRTLNSGSIYLFAGNDSNVSDSNEDPLNRVPCFRNIDDPLHVHNQLSELIEAQNK